MKNLTAKGRNEQAERMAERVTQVSNRREKKARSKSAGREHLACPQKGRKLGGWGRQEHGQLELMITPQSLIRPLAFTLHKTGPQERVVCKGCDQILLQ